MTVTIEVKAQAGKLQELYQTLQALLSTMRDEKGCRDCRVSRDVENGEVFLFFSDWELKGNFEGYIHSDNGRVLLEQTARRVGQIPHEQRCPLAGRKSGPLHSKDLGRAVRFSVC